MNLRNAKKIEYCASMVEEAGDMDIVNIVMNCDALTENEDSYVISDKNSTIVIPKIRFDYDLEDDCYEAINNNVYYYIRILDIVM